MTWNVFTALGYNTAHWGPALATAAPDLPTSRLLAWIGKESQGNPASLGSPAEVGLMQIDTSDTSSFQTWSRETLHGTGTFASGTSGPNGQFLTRALTSDEEDTQVQSSIAFARFTLAQAQALIGSNGWDDSDTWAMTKMIHSLGHGGTTWLVNQATTAGNMTSWAAFKGYANSLARSDVPSKIDPTTGKETGLRRYWPFMRYTNLGDIVGGASGAVGTVRGLVGLDLVTSMALAATIALAWWFSR